MLKDSRLVTSARGPRLAKSSPQVLCGNYYQDRLDWIPDGAPPFYVSPVFHFGRDNLGVEAASASAEHFAGTPPVTNLQVLSRVSPFPQP